MTDQQSKLEKMAQSLYSAHISNHPAIHCNRFPSWAELTNASRKHWVATAKFADAFREDNGDKGRENPAEAPTNRNTDPIWQALWELAEDANGPHELSRGEMVDRAWRKFVGEMPAQDELTDSMIETTLKKHKVKPTLCLNGNGPDNPTHYSVRIFNAIRELVSHPHPHRSQK